MVDVDFIGALGALLTASTGVEWAGQEPQDKETVTSLILIERVTGVGVASEYGRSDRPWVELTAVGPTKKTAYDLMLQIRRTVVAPRTWLGNIYQYSVEEVLSMERSTAQRDPFYRYRTTFEFHVKGLV